MDEMDEERESELYETLVSTCVPGKPEYDREFHCQIYSRQPDWFDGEDGLLPPSESNGIDERRRIISLLRAKGFTLSEKEVRDFVADESGGAQGRAS